MDDVTDHIPDRSDWEPEEHSERWASPPPETPPERLDGGPIRGVDTQYQTGRNRNADSEASPLVTSSAR